MLCPSWNYQKWWSGRLTYCRRASITSCAISEATKKRRKYSQNPICRQSGTNMLISSIYLVNVKDGSMYIIFHASCFFTCRRQNPSLMYKLSKQNDWLRLWLSAKVVMILFTYCSNLSWILPVLVRCFPRLHNPRAVHCIYVSDLSQLVWDNCGWWNLELYWGVSLNYPILYHLNKSIFDLLCSFGVKVRNDGERIFQRVWDST